MNEFLPGDFVRILTGKRAGQVGIVEWVGPKYAGVRVWNNRVNYRQVYALKNLNLHERQEAPEDD